VKPVFFILKRELAEIVRHLDALSRMTTASLVP
jgi:hypothetical protein